MTAADLTQQHANSPVPHCGIGRLGSEQPARTAVQSPKRLTRKGLQENLLTATAPLPKLMGKGFASIFPLSVEDHRSF